MLLRLAALGMVTVGTASARGGGEDTVLALLPSGPSGFALLRLDPANFTTLPLCDLTRLGSIDAVVPVPSSRRAVLVLAVGVDYTIGFIDLSTCTFDSASAIHVDGSLSTGGMFWGAFWDEQQGQAYYIDRHYPHGGETLVLSRVDFAARALQRVAPLSPDLRQILNVRAASSDGSPAVALLLFANDTSIGVSTLEFRRGAETSRLPFTPSNLGGFDFNAFELVYDDGVESGSTQQRLLTRLRPQHQLSYSFGEISLKTGNLTLLGTFPPGGGLTDDDNPGVFLLWDGGWTSLFDDGAEWVLFRIELASSSAGGGQYNVKKSPCPEQGVCKWLQSSPFVFRNLTLPEPRERVTPSTY